MSYNAMNQNRNCTLHGGLFEYFCEKCLEPVCRQCTIIGPHHTQIHPITNIAAAYQRRVHEIQSRISCFLQNKQTIIQAMSYLHLDMEELKEMQNLSEVENERYRSRMLVDLQKSYQRIVNEIILIKEELEIRINQINDLGHTFEHITDEIEVVASQSSILQSMKESYDRIILLLNQNHTFQELPRELSDLRLDLTNIQVYKDLIDQKTKLIHQIFRRMDEEKLKIQQPTINFPNLLQQLSANITECVQHNVCHYCGIVFTLSRANTLCPKNNSTLDINQFVGFCSKNPDSSRWATHKHYFSTPADQFSYFKTEEETTFQVHLNALLLKLRTICQIKKIDLRKKFDAADKAKVQRCDRIAMLYTLMQGCGLTENESYILLSICDLGSQGYAYVDLLSRLQKIAI